MATHTAERRELTRLPSGIPVTTTVHTYEGETDGPTLYLQAAQHGREVNGTAVLRRLHDQLCAATLDGRVVTVPVADPLTFDHASYTTPEPLDSVNANMNRVWPGDADGTLHERMAASLWSLVAEADAVVDLHTGSRDMLTHVVFKEGDEDARALATAFGTDLLLGEPADEDADDEWHARDFAGKLRVAAADADIPAITPELAHNRAIVEPAVETGVTGVTNVLATLDMLDGPVTHNGDPVLARNHLGRVTAEDSGLFRPHPDVTVGDTVTAGDPLGTLYDPMTYAVRQEAVADRDGILYSLNRGAIVTAGSTVGSVAERRDSSA
ncbi:MAG: succinylglutamate desuccinylase/aspartoacylase family protein [Halobacteriaceae archaeon]